MATRLDLHNRLLEFTKNVYYQPPASISMCYPAIRVSRKSIDNTYANGNKYSKRTKYEIIVISKKPDDPLIDMVLTLPYSSYDRRYVANNLYHDSITLYY